MEQQQKKLLVFGFGLPVVLLVLGAGHWHQHGFDATAAALLAVAGFVLLITLFNRPMLQVLFKYWMKAAGLIGVIVTTVILSVLFFGVFSVVGIILRLLRKDLLHLRLCPEARSYWVIRAQDTEDLTRYTRQF